VEASPTFETPLPERRRSDLAPSKRHAALSGAACKAALEREKLLVKVARGKTTGMETPLQLSGPLHGVNFELPGGLYGFLDCRLVLVMSDLAKELARFGIVAVEVNNTYRPASVLPAKAKPTPAPKAASKGRRKPRPTKAPLVPIRLSQHARGLALDITEFRVKDGRVLNVERDWKGPRGVPPCGPKAQVAANDPNAALLRDVTCAIARAGLCNHLITPSRDEAHKNHLHCDIEANAAEVMVE
jgi:hypothetical protein